MIAVGSVARTLPIPGLAEHALDSATWRTRSSSGNHVLRRLEAATAATSESHRRRELTFVFVGAGYAGVEALAELADLVRDALRFYPGPATSRSADPRGRRAEDPPDPDLGLADMPPSLGRRGIEIRTRTMLEAVEPHAAVLSGGERVLTSTVVWTV